MPRTLSLLIVFFLCGVCEAEDKPYADTVTSRDRPELSPLGINASGFRLFPSISITEIFDDNIFAENTDEVDDVITISRPEISIRSNWKVHALNFRAGTSIGRYSDNSNENYEDFDFSIDGRLDIRRGTQLVMSARVRDSHVDRDSPDDEDGIEPTFFTAESVSAIFDHRNNRLSTRVSATTKRLDYDDVRAAGGVINNDDRDRDELSAGLKLAYEILPYNDVFLRFAIDTTDYVARLDDNGLNRSAEGYQIDIGSDFRISGILFGEVFIGRINREFEDPTLETIDAVSAGGSLSWIPTGLTTLNFSLLRETHETVVGTSSGILATEARLDIDHELLRNLLLRASASRSIDDFNGSNREDDYVEYGLGATYLMNRFFNLVLDYKYEDRNSSVAGGVQDFRNQTIAVTLRLQR